MTVDGSRYVIPTACRYGDFARALRLVSGARIAPEKWLQIPLQSPASVRAIG
jgi:hypothetical protein